MNRHSVAGKRLHFTFKDGPMEGRTFEHVFEKHGALRFRDVDKADDGVTVKKYESASIGTDVCVVSYLGPSGYTLTVALD